MNDRSLPPSPTSPMSHRRQPILAGFRPAPRPKQRIEEMTLRELQDLHCLNAKILSSPGASTSTYVDRVSVQQAQLEARLIELEGMETINTALKKAKIEGEGDMNVDPTEVPVSRTIEAKRRALHKFAPAYGESVPGRLSLQDAMNLEQQAHMREKERIERIAEKKRRLGMPIKGEVLTRQEREARIWAYMNHKPTESDMEDKDDDDDSDEDDDPASWFEDDQDDGRKGQDIIEPDVEDLSDIIRIDESRIPYSTFYQPRDDGD